MKFKCQNRKIYFFCVLCFILGFILGAIATSGIALRYVSGIVSLDRFEHRAFLSDKAEKAYRDEAPQVAIWALQALIDFIKYFDHIPTEEDGHLEIFSDLSIAHARLALLHKCLGNDKQYIKNSEKAFELGKASGAKMLATPDSIWRTLEIWREKNVTAKECPMR